MITKQEFKKAYLLNRFPFAIGNLRWNWKKPAAFTSQQLSLF
tara:strand:- start:1187 stop:1312 length:126 start_codon:yes stop_codon:yes gene_type:complete